MSDKLELYAEQIFSRWKAQFLAKPRHERKVEFISGEVDSFVAPLKHKEVPFEIVNPYIEKMIEVYKPNRSIMEQTFKNLRSKGKAKGSLDEFSNQWITTIRVNIENAFHGWYPIEDQQEIDSLISEHKKQVSQQKTAASPENADVVKRQVLKNQQELAEYAETIPELPEDFLMELMKKRPCGLQ